MSDQQDCTRTHSGVAASGPAHPSHPPQPWPSPGGGWRQPASSPGEPTDPLGPPAAIREALLWRLENREAAELLRRLGAVLFDFVDETGQFGPPSQETGLTRPTLRAASMDLFHVARDLAEVALSGQAATLGEQDAGLAEHAEVWSARVTTIAAAIREAAGE